MSDDQKALELRDRIANLLLARSGGWMQPIREMPEEKAHGDADAILAALGLDNLDAAVERMARALDHEDPKGDEPIKSAFLGRRWVLQREWATKMLAALLATDGAGGK